MPRKLDETTESAITTAKGGKNRKKGMSILPSWIRHSALEREHEAGNFFNAINTFGLILLLTFNTIAFLVPVIWAGILGTTYSETLAPFVDPGANVIFDSTGKPVNITKTRNIIKSLVIRVNILAGLASRICSKIVFPIIKTGILAITYPKYLSPEVSANVFNLIQFNLSVSDPDILGSLITRINYLNQLVNELCNSKQLNCD